MFSWHAAQYQSCKLVACWEPVLCCDAGDVYRWHQDLRFRLKDNHDIGSATLNIELKDAPGAMQYLGGNTIGKATIDASIIVGELDKLRSEALSIGGHQPLGFLPAYLACTRAAGDVAAPVCDGYNAPTYFGDMRQTPIFWRSQDCSW